MSRGTQYSTAMKPYDYVMILHQLDATLLVEPVEDYYNLRIRIGGHPLPEDLLAEVYKYWESIVEALLRRAEVFDRIETAKAKIDRESPGRIDWELRNEDVSKAERELEVVMLDYINGDCPIDAVALFYKAYVTSMERPKEESDGELDDLISIFA